MKTLINKLAIAAALGLLVAPALLPPHALRAQTPWGYQPSPTTPMAQQNALGAVQSQVNWLQNATRTASNYATGAYGLVWQQFQQLQGAYIAFKNTLNAQQLSSGANELAELDQGLGILEESFTDYNQDIADGQSSDSALDRMCQDLDEAAGVWWQQMQQDCQGLNVGQ